MTWLNFLLQANIYLLVFYAFYKFLLAKETYFQLNRLYLIGSGLFAVCIPFIRLDWLMQQPLSQQLSVTFGELDMMVLPDENQSSNGLAAGDIVALLYTAGLLFFLLRFCLQVFLLGRRLYAAGISKDNEGSGTAYSFLTRKSVDPGLPGQEIINHHEDIHLKQLHSLDVLLFELIAIINWFNPVVYLYKRALRDNHEFLADEAAAHYQGDKEGYSLLLLSAAFKVSPQALTNSFFSKQSLIKKRIYMLHKEKSKRAAILKYGLYLPLFSSMLLLSSANFREDPSVLKAVETIPFNDPIDVVTQALPATDRNATIAAATNGTVASGNNLQSPERTLKFQQDWAPFYKFIAGTIKYPEQARKQKIQGNTQLKFSLENGEVKGLDALTKLGAGLDAEVMKAILNYKGFNGVTDGDYVLGVAFRLVDANTPVKNEKLEEVAGFTNLKLVTVNGFSTNHAVANADATNKERAFDFVSVDEKPEFPDGIKAFYSYLGKSIKYPKEAVEKNIQGKVFTQFVIEKDGSVSNIKVMSGPGYGTNEEALRVLEQSPKWNPGKKNGAPVRVMYFMPISFTLSSDKGAPKSSVENTNLNSAAGKVENVVVVSQNGSKTSNSNGNTTTKGPEPVYLVDGVVASKQALELIDKDNIERIDVKKDAGTGATGGTINITLKKD